LKKRILSVIQYLFFLLIGIILLWLVFRKIEIKDVVAQIRGAKYEWLLLSMFLGIFSHIARAMRWNILIRSMGYKTDTQMTFYAVMVGYLANTAFPRLGEVTRCGVLAKKKNIPFNALFGTVISERVFDMIVLMIIIVAVILLQLSMLSDFVNKYIISYLTGIANRNNLIMAIILLIVVIILPLVLFRIFFTRIKKLHIYNKLIDFLRGLLDGVKTILKIRQKWSFLALTVVIWTLYTLMTYTAFYALEATSSLNFFDAITVMSLGSLGMVAPVPGGIGAYQFVVKAILTEIYMIPSEPAVSYSIILWAAQSFMIIVLGAASYYILVFKKSKIDYVNSESNSK
jgi:glycosyltransferase 2 family protein